MLKRRKIDCGLNSKGTHYKHTLGKNVELALTHLRAKGFMVRWSYIKQAYDCRRRVGQNDIHIVIKQKRGVWEAKLHLDEIIAEGGAVTAHRVLHDSKLVEKIGKSIFEHMPVYE